MGRDELLKEQPPEQAGEHAHGADIPVLARLGAKYVDKILQGAKPDDLPVEKTNQIPIRYQREHRKGTRPSNASNLACYRRRGSRMSPDVLIWPNAKSERALIWSAVDQKWLTDFPNDAF